MASPLIDYLDEGWQHAVENVRDSAAAIWDRQVDRHAIDHGSAHAQRVVRLLDWLTQGLMAHGETPLAEKEIYVLLAATYLHAIGLQDEHSEPDLNARWRRYPELGAELVYRTQEAPDEAFDLKLVDDPSLVEMIGLVVAGHRQTQYPSPDYDDFQVGGTTVRPRLLTALLCLADGLELDYRRVDLIRLKLMDLTAEEQLEWHLPYYVSGIELENEYIRFTYRVPQGREDYATLLPELVEGQVRADFGVLRDIFRPYGVYTDIAPAGSVRAMRTVKPMAPEIWAAAEARLAALRSPSRRPPTDRPGGRSSVQRGAEPRAPAPSPSRTRAPPGQDRTTCLPQEAGRPATVAKKNQEQREQLSEQGQEIRKGPKGFLGYS